MTTDSTEVARENRCDICCRPRAEHIGRRAECPEVSYFRPMPGPTVKARDDCVMCCVNGLPHNCPHQKKPRSILAYSGDPA